MSRFSAAVLGGLQVNGISILPSLAKQNPTEAVASVPLFSRRPGGTQCSNNRKSRGDCHGFLVYEREALLFEELVQPVKGELLLLSGV